MDLTLDIDLFSHRTAAAISESLRVAHIGSNRAILGGHHDYIVRVDRGGRSAFGSSTGLPRASSGIYCHNLYHMQTGMMTEVRYDGIAA
jgi:hypothetical protein